MATVTSYAIPFRAIYWSNGGKAPAFSYSSAAISFPRCPKSHLLTSIPRWNVGLVSHWNGLRHPGISTRQIYWKRERKGKRRGMVVYASLFGVGAPEVLVIGVVALLVFGPKGLAEVARNLGKTLRAFQPTIRELQDVSREFKTTLEREIGLDEVQSLTKNTSNSSHPYANENPPAKVDPNGTSPTKAPNSSEDFLEVTPEQQTTPGVAEQQEGTMAPKEQPQDSTSTTRAPYSSEELLKVTQEQLRAAAVANEHTSPEHQPQVSAPESKPLSEKPENER